VRVLLAHNFYRSSAPSGEDAAYRHERSLLEKNGVEVVPFERFNDDLDDSTFAKRVRIARECVWSNDSFAAIRDLVRKTRPDVAHFHNTFPQISPSGYAACKDLRVPVVQTLHNYRLLCPGGLLMRGGRPCEECASGALLPSLRYRCYRNSLSATIPVAWMLYRNRRRGIYAFQVDRYIALTRFARGKFGGGVLPADRISVRPNFLSEPPSPGEGRGGYVVYVGRLSEEKGVLPLLAGWKFLPGVLLKIVGDGPLRGRMEEAARQGRMNVEFLGYRGNAEAVAIVREARLSVLPSLCYESFPLTVIESYACGTPVVASRIGGLAEIVRDGVTGATVRPDDPADIAFTVRGLLADPGRLSELRGNARREFESLYAPDRAFDTLLEIYRDVLQGRIPR